MNFLNFLNFLAGIRSKRGHLKYQALVWMDAGKISDLSLWPFRCWRGRVPALRNILPIAKRS